MLFLKKFVCSAIRKRCCYAKMLTTTSPSEIKEKIANKSHVSLGLKLSSTTVHTQKMPSDGLARSVGKSWHMSGFMMLSFAHSWDLNEVYCGV